MEEDDNASVPFKRIIYYAIKDGILEKGIDKVDAEIMLEWLEQVTLKKAKLFSTMVSYPLSDRYYYQIFYSKKYMEALLIRTDFEVDREPNDYDNHEERYHSARIYLGKRESQKRRTIFFYEDAIEIDITDILRKLKFPQRIDIDEWRI